MKRPRKYPIRYSCIYHSDEDDRDKGLSIVTLMSAMAGLVLIYGTIMVGLYHEEVGKFFYSIVRWLML